jgi:hypothetical protein
LTRFLNNYLYEGDGVSIFGPVYKAADAATFSASLDDGPPFSYSPPADRFRPQALLYHATNLGEGQHKVKLTYSNAYGGKPFAIDYANVYTVNGSAASASTVSDTPSPGPDQKSKGISSGAAAGIATGACFLIFAMGLLGFFLFRQRSQKRPDSRAGNTFIPYSTHRAGGGSAPALNVSSGAGNSVYSSSISGSNPQRLEKSELPPLISHSPRAPEVNFDGDVGGNINWVCILCYLYDFDWIELKATGPFGNEEISQLKRLFLSGVNGYRLVPSRKSVWL